MRKKKTWAWIYFATGLFENEKFEFIPTGIYDSPYLLLHHTLTQTSQNIKQIYIIIILFLGRKFYSLLNVLDHTTIRVLCHFILRFIFFLLQSYYYAIIVWIYLCMGTVIDFSVDDDVKIWRKHLTINQFHSFSLSLFINGPFLSLNTLTNMHKYPKQNPS